MTDDRRVLTRAVQALQGVHRLRQRRGGIRPLFWSLPVVIRRTRRHSHKPNLSSTVVISRNSPGLTELRSYCTVTTVQYVR